MKKEGDPLGNLLPIASWVGCGPHMAGPSSQGLEFLGLLGNILPNFELEMWLLGICRRQRKTVMACARSCFRIR